MKTIPLFILVIDRNLNFILNSFINYFYSILLGDLKKPDKILEWLISMKDPSLDMIEEIDGKILRKLLATQDHVAVYFCKYQCLMFV